MWLHSTYANLCPVIQDNSIDVHHEGDVEYPTLCFGSCSHRFTVSKSVIDSLGLAFDTQTSLMNDEVLAGEQRHFITSVYRLKGGGAVGKRLFEAAQWSHHRPPAHIYSAAE